MHWSRGVVQDSFSSARTAPKQRPGRQFSTGQCWPFSSPRCGPPRGQGSCSRSAHVWALNWSTRGAPWLCRVCLVPAEWGFRGRMLSCQRLTCVAFVGEVLMGLVQQPAPPARALQCIGMCVRVCPCVCARDCIVVYLCVCVCVCVCVFGRLLRCVRVCASVREPQRFFFLSAVRMCLSGLSFTLFCLCTAGC